MKDRNYIELRKKIFELSPSEIGIEMDGDSEIPYGVIMEMGIDDETATLISFIDGNASLYFSTGGAMIGGVSFENVRNSALKFVKKASEFLHESEKCTKFPFADDGDVVFYVLTMNGVYKIESDEKSLENLENKFFSLYSAGQDLLTELREIEELNGS